MPNILVRPQKTPLRGTVKVPGDKSISHRAIMLAAMADGTSHIRNWLPAGDTIATLEAFRSMGVSIQIQNQTAQAWDLVIEGRGMRGLRPPDGPLDCKNAGTCMRLIAGLLAGQSFPVTVDGSPQLRKRPMRRISEPLSQMGVQIETTDGKAPLRIRPSTPQPMTMQMNVASAQVKSAVLLAGLYADGPTTIIEAGPSRDHTERMLSAMGVDMTWGDGTVTLRPPAALQPLDMDVPSDTSSAAFPILAASIVPHSQITLTGVGMNDTRTGILDMLRGMGASFEFTNERETSGEPVADITVRFAELHKTAVSGPTVVRGIDEIPIWSVAATQAAGQSTVRDAAELRVKEVDRISVLAGELRKLGVEIAESPDGFTVDGPMRLFANEVDSHDDHRLGMSLAVAGLVTHGVTLIKDASCVADSFPGFVETMQALGASMEWIDA